MLAEAIFADAFVGGGANLHLPLGAVSYETTMAKLERLAAEYASLEAVARGADASGSATVVADG